MNDAAARADLETVLGELARAGAVGVDGDADGGGTSTAGALLALEAVHRLRDLLTGWEPLLIEDARRGGASWAELASALGVTSRQAAERRYLRLRPMGDAALTREQRVQQTRDQRAGERAVAGWARENASHLRQVAGQASALAGLTSAGRRRARLLRESLDGDDPVDLLQPLAAMHVDLRDGHDGLAAQVRAITRRVTKLRSDTQRERDRSARR